MLALKHKGIPTLLCKGIVDLHICQQCEINKVSCLVLGLEVGIPVELAYKNDLVMIQEAYGQMRSVLRYMHGADWDHLDI